MIRLMVFDTAPTVIAVPWTVPAASPVKGNAHMPAHNNAFVYVRQSTPDQLINNPESRRRQYALAIRARSLGWEYVVVIDDAWSLGRRYGAARL